MRGTHLFRQRSFALLWVAGLISMTGDWLLTIALPIYVYRLTGSPAATAGIIAANVGAALVVGTVAGVYVDRWDRRRLLVVANVLQALVLLPLLLVDSPSRLWIVLVVAVLEASIAQFTAPAEHALLPRLVPERELPSANALNALNNNIARLIGPAIGGVAAATIGLVGVTLLDAATYVIAAVLVALIGGAHRAAGVVDRAASGLRRWWREFTQGLRVVSGSVTLRALFAVVAVTAVGEGIMGSLFAVYVDRGLGGGAPEIGWLMSAQAVGGIAGGLLSVVLARRIRPVPMVTAGLIAFGLIDIVIFNYPRWFTALPPVIALFVLVGLPGAIGVAAMMTLLQTEVGDGLRGRVFAAAAVAKSGAALVGAVAAATLTDRFGVINVLTAQGAGYVVAGAAFAIMVRRGRPARRRIRLPEPERALAAPELALAATHRRWQS